MVTAMFFIFIVNSYRLIDSNMTNSTQINEAQKFGRRGSLCKEIYLPYLATRFCIAFFRLFILLAGLLELVCFYFGATP